jgi:hypothetical protein
MLFEKTFFKEGTYEPFSIPNRNDDPRKGLAKKGFPILKLKCENWKCIKSILSFLSFVRMRQ